MRVDLSFFILLLQLLVCISFLHLLRGLIYSISFFNGFDVFSFS